MMPAPKSPEFPQRAVELLDRRDWPTQDDLAKANFE